MIAAIAIAGIVLLAAGIGYLVTTFLFAFSGGQYRMVTVVNAGALCVIALGLAAAVVGWMIRSPEKAIKWAAFATGIGWPVALIAEWLISFQLGAA
ncbi:MAG TPA: hypothetical protein VGK28_07390 [Candidatus Dormibacteraeota bacterium]